MFFICFSMIQYETQNQKRYWPGNVFKLALARRCLKNGTGYELS